MYILSLLLCALRNRLMPVMEHDGGRGARVKQAVITAGRGPVSLTGLTILFHILFLLERLEVLFPKVSLETFLSKLCCS